MVEDRPLPEQRLVARAKRGDITTYEEVVRQHQTTAFRVAYWITGSRAVARATPGWLRARSFPGGSMGPKVEAVCRFVETTGHRAAIGQVEQLEQLIDGTAGTQIEREGSDVEHARVSPAHQRQQRQ